MATLKHLGSKNADYGAAEQYLLFEHDEFTMKPVLDENGRLIPREDYRLSTLNEWHSPYPQLAGEVRAAVSDLAALKFEVLQKVGDAVGNIQTYQL